jgi:hypothetical protein
MKKLILVALMLFALNGCYSETEIEYVVDCNCGIVDDKYITLGNLFLIGVENDCTGNIVYTVWDEDTYYSVEAGDVMCDPILDF